MGKKLVNKYTVGIFLLALTSLTIFGCGKSVVGPTAPQAISSQVLGAVQQSTAISGANAEANSFQAACLGKKGKWTNRTFCACLLKFNPWSVKKFINNVLKLDVVDPEVKSTVQRILRCRLFYIITFRCGLGHYLFKACLGVLKQSWSPGLGTNPGGFDPEVTLFPYAWNPYSGFYGDLESRGWTNGEGYYFKSTNVHVPETFTKITTKSYFNNVEGYDIYKNNEEANEIFWDFMHSPKKGTGELSWINLGLFLNSSSTQWMQCIVIKSSHNGSPVIREPNGNYIYFTEVRASTQNKAAVCNMSSTRDGLNMTFELDEAGKGGGTLSIPNSQGVIDEYYFKVKRGNGRSYWTKNNGRKNFF
jgi:hypothetical protein